MIVDSKTLPDKAHDFRVVRSVIRVIEDNFGMDPEDKEQDKS